MDILQDKPGTKRPAIVEAATALFAERGIDATSMRDVAEAAGVREAAIYRHFAGKDEMSREIFVSWYGWYSRQLREIVAGSGKAEDKVHRAARLELKAAEEHPQAFTYFCESEPRFLRALPREVPRIHEVLVQLVRDGQDRGEVRAGDARAIADMLGGALCGVTLSWIRRGRRGGLSRHAALVAEAAWAMIAAQPQDRVKAAQ
jgi:AcrR family transcriptional regulator